MLQSLGSQRVGHDLETEQQPREDIIPYLVISARAGLTKQGWLGRWNPVSCWSVPSGTTVLFPYIMLWSSEESVVTSFPLWLDFLRFSVLWDRGVAVWHRSNDQMCCFFGVSTINILVIPFRNFNTVQSVFKLLNLTVRRRTLGRNWVFENDQLTNT